MNVNRIPFRQMKATLALLQGAVLPIMAVLDTKTMERADLLIVAQVLLARDRTAVALKNNPTRRQLLIWCGAWYKLAEQVQALIPAEGAPLRVNVQDALTTLDWVKELDPETKPSEVKP